MSKTKLYQDKSGEYRWIGRHDGDGRGEPTSKESARDAVGKIRMTASGAEIEGV